MDKGQVIKPTFTFRFKDVPGSSSGGCHALVWLPENKTKKLPVALMIHGGGFTMEAAIDIPFNNVNYYLENGFIVVSLEYRLMPHVKLSDIRQDLLDGYMFVQNGLEQELQKAGSQVTVDGIRINVQGWSAGGTATMFISYDIQEHNKTASTPLPMPKANIVTYPMCRVDRQHNNPRSDLEKFSEGLTEEERKVLNAIYDEPISTGHPHEDWTPASKTPRMKWLMSVIQSGTINSFLIGQDPPYPPKSGCIETVNSGTPPTCVVVATADTLLGTEDSYELAKLVGEAGVESKLYIAQDMPHGIAEHPSSTWPADVKWWDDAILPALKWAVERTLA